MSRKANNGGFAFVEIVMEAVSVTGIVTMLAIVGVQSTIAASNASASRAQAHLEAVRSDLENLVAYEALHFADEATYAGSPEELHLVTSEGVDVQIVASRSGWSATATHAALPPGAGCAIFVGGAQAPTTPAAPSAPAQIACTE